jgi:hypothetical protein
MVYTKGGIYHFWGGIYHEATFQMKRFGKTLRRAWVRASEEPEREE